jgi:hypothetical protein
MLSRSLVIVTIEHPLLCYDWFRLCNEPELIELATKKSEKDGGKVEAVKRWQLIGCWLGDSTMELELESQMSKDSCTHRNICQSLNSHSQRHQPFLSLHLSLFSACDVLELCSVLVIGARRRCRKQ